MPPKMLWLKQHEPAIYAQTAQLLEFTDWIAYRLTGRYTLNMNTVTQRWFYHAPGGGWPTDFFAAIGLPDLVDKFLRTFCRSARWWADSQRRRPRRWACPPASPWPPAAATPSSACWARASPRRVTWA
ncbi:MAG: FGGY family carbohydrate kinase [Caldilineaceae bacterium]